MLYLKVLLTVILCYLIGNFSTGVALSRLHGGNDIRKEGSGNAGATNMLRVKGRSMAIMTLAGDMLKGMLGVCVGWWLLGADFGRELSGLIGAFASILGHDFPVLLGFKGGKGISTSFGALLLLFPIQSVLLLLSFIVIVAISHYVSVGSVASAVLYPIYIIISTSLRPAAIVIVICIGLLAIFCHRSNIKRLIDGKENRLDFSMLKGKKKA